MTENKRFEMIITCADGSFHYLDKITGEKITSTLELENKLNELNNENVQLKSDCDYRWKKYCNTRKEMLHENEQLKRENKQLKQRINSRLHFYRELYDSTNDDIVKRVVEDLEDILKE